VVGVGGVSVRWASDGQLAPGERRALPWEGSHQRFLSQPQRDSNPCRHLERENGALRCLPSVPVGPAQSGDLSRLVPLRHDAPRRVDWQMDWQTSRRRPTAPATNGFHHEAAPRGHPRAPPRPVRRRSGRRSVRCLRHVGHSGSAIFARRTHPARCRRGAARSRRVRLADPAAPLKSYVWLKRTDGRRVLLARIETADTSAVSTSSSWAALRISPRSRPPSPAGPDGEIQQPSLSPSFPRSHSRPPAVGGRRRRRTRTRPRARPYR
jgi:hypothetical protein